MRAVRVDIVLPQRRVVPRWDGSQVGVAEDGLPQVVETVVPVEDAVDVAVYGVVIGVEGFADVVETVEGVHYF